MNNRPGLPVYIAPPITEFKQTIKVVYYYYLFYHYYVCSRAAARCNKGVEVLYTIAVEHFIQVAFYIRRGATQADTCVNQLRSVLHCQRCEEWAVYPDTRAPVGGCQLYFNLVVHLQRYLVVLLGKSRSFL